MATLKKPLVETIADSLARQIADGTLRFGDKLPSIREFAKVHGYAKNTVVNAFEILAAKGIIEPRRGSGYFVARAPRPATPDDEPNLLERAMDTVWLMREQLKNTPDELRVADGFPPIEWLAECRLDKYYQKVIRTGLGTMFRYGSRFGYMPLRQNLVQKMAGLEIKVNPNQIVLTHGANQAMDIVIRYFLKPGDTVLVDDPGYYPLFGKLKLHGVRIVGVPRTPDGPDVAVLERLLQVHKIRLFFTQSVGHNPTAADISPAKAHRVLQLAEKYDLLIVEDDPFVDFKPTSMCRMSTLDQLHRTIYIGSFSKSVSAALRVGFIACHPDLASDLADVKMLVHVSSSEYCERTLDVVLNEGHFHRHISRLRDRVEKATDQARRVLTSLDATIFCAPRQTLYLWATLPGVENSLDLAKELMKKKIVLAPGAIFSVDPQQPVAWCRYNVAQVTDARFLSAISGINA
jgi:DNA-binding transcriptional MocR family regulator